jgi:hypothetical protein
MVRMQIQFTEPQVESLRRLAAEDGKSLAEVVRSGVELYLRNRKGGNPSDRTARARRAAGRFRSGLKDVSRQHDRYLSGAFDQ